MMKIGLTNAHTVMLQKKQLSSLHLNVQHLKKDWVRKGVGWAGGEWNRQEGSGTGRRGVDRQEGSGTGRRGVDRQEGSGTGRRE